MAGPSGKPLPSVIANLLESPHTFSFFQAVQLLSAYAQARHGQTADAFLRDSLRVRADLTLAFPASDIVSCEIERPQPSAEHADEGAVLERYRLVATFLGLYGTGSPLPTYYTEDLLDEAGEDGSVVRDFLDIAASPFFSLLYRGWTKYRLMLKIDVERDETYLEELYSFLGLGEPAFRKNLSVGRKALRYLGLMSQFPRSACGLEGVIADFTGISRVEVEQCVLRDALIPEDQRAFLGCLNHRLGMDMVFGSRMADRTGKIIIHLYSLDAERFHALHPLTALYEELRQLVRLYLTDPLEYELHAALMPDEARTARLGVREWGSLGWNTWLFSGNARKTPVAPIPMSHLGPAGPLSSEVRTLFFHDADYAWT